MFFCSYSLTFSLKDRFLKEFREHLPVLAFQWRYMKLPRFSAKENTLWVQIICEAVQLVKSWESWEQAVCGTQQQYNVVSRARPLIIEPCSLELILVMEHRGITSHRKGRTGERMWGEKKVKLGKKKKLSLSMWKREMCKWISTAV